MSDHTVDRRDGLRLEQRQELTRFFTDENNKT